MPLPFCERLVGRLSDYERDLWTPKPFERVRVLTDSSLGTFIGTAGHVRVFNGDDLGRLVQTVDAVRPVVIIDEPLVAVGPEWLRVCEWTDLEPAPPAGCECPSCWADRLHACGCADHDCGCPAGGCMGGCTSQERRAR